MTRPTQNQDEDDEAHLYADEVFYEVIIPFYYNRTCEMPLDAIKCLWDHYFIEDYISRNMMLELNRHRPIFPILLNWVTDSPVQDDFRRMGQNDPVSDSDSDDE